MRKQEFDFEKRPTERPDPVHYLRKREGSPGGLKPPTAGSSLQLATGLIPAQRGSPQSASGSPASGKPRPTLFRKKYDRGELPVRVDQDRPGRNGLRWTADLAAIDLHLYLPIFVEGLQETQVGGWTVGVRVGGMFRDQEPRQYFEQGSVARAGRHLRPLPSLLGRGTRL